MCFGGVIWQVLHVEMKWRDSYEWRCEMWEILRECSIRLIFWQVLAGQVCYDRCRGEGLRSDGCKRRKNKWHSRRLVWRDWTPEKMAPVQVNQSDPWHYLQNIKQVALPWPVATLYWHTDDRWCRGGADTENKHADGGLRGDIVVYCNSWHLKIWWIWRL